MKKLQVFVAVISYYVTVINTWEVACLHYTKKIQVRSAHDHMDPPGIGRSNRYKVRAKRNYGGRSTCHKKT